MVKEKQVDLLLIAILFLVIFSANLPFAKLQSMSPDASVYLDIGRNLFSGNGMVISYNINQYWPEKYHPALPYTHPIYPVVAGILWYLFASLKVVIGFNIFLYAINCVLLYKIIRLYAGELTSFLIILFLGFAKGPVYAAIYPWTEQLHFFSLLVAIFLYLKYENSSFWVGVLLGISCLIRIGGLFSVLAFGLALLVLKGISKEALREYLIIILGFALILITYEGFCILRYGAVYPERFVAGKTFKFAQLYHGAYYESGQPVLNAPPVTISKSIVFSDFLTSLKIFFSAFGSLNFLFILIPFYIFLVPRNRTNPLFIIFFFQAVFVIFGYVSHTSQFGQVKEVFPESDAWRYSLIPLTTLGCIGFLAVRDFCNQFLLPRFNEKFAIAAFFLVMLTFFTLEMNRYLDFRNYFMNEYPKIRLDYDTKKLDIYEWIKKNSEPDDLVASGFHRDAFLFARPFVSLPKGKAMNKENLVHFLEIYEPDYIYTGNPILIKFMTDEKGYNKATSSGTLVLLSRH